MQMKKGGKARKKKVIYLLNIFFLLLLSSKSAFLMISEEPCDTEYSSTDAENSALASQNLLHFTIYLNRKLLFSIVVIFYCIFDQINAALVNKRDFLNSKLLKGNVWSVALLFAFISFLGHGASVTI